MNYYISDLHLFHNNIINLAHRPFRDVSEMHEALKKNWKRVVKKNDMVYILGDLGLYHADEISQFIRDLPGRKILITGNHDMKNLKNRNLREAFVQITPYAEIKDNGRTVVLFHYPIEEWDGFYRGFYHLYGHVHDNDGELAKIDRRYNVSCDKTDFTPMTLDQLIKRG